MKLISFLVILVFLLGSCSPVQPSSTSLLATEASQTLPSTPSQDQASTPSQEIQSPTATSAPAVTQIPPASPTPAAAPMTLGLTLAASGFNKPVYLTYPPDGSGRLFVVEQPGFIRIIKNGNLLPNPFLDITQMVNSRGNEEGLLGLAFHPQYSQNGRFFVHYTDSSQSVVIARFNVSASNPDQADPASEKILLTIPHPFTNHNGGQLVFGPDGYLYIGVGDGGSQGDPNLNGQNLKVLLAKILRIDVNGDSYAIPPSNPFANKPGARPEIWAYGLRNPWRVSFDMQTNDLYIGDVGQDLYEEVDFQPSNDKGGENYGWSFMEGFHPYKGSAPAGLTAPVAEYSHAGGNCAIVGGYVYRGKNLPDLVGTYIFGDYCTGYMWSLKRSGSTWQMKSLMNAPFSISSFGEDAAGELYVLDLNGGALYRLGKPQN